MPTPKTSTTSDSVVNDYVAVASISARKKNSSRTMTPTPPLVIPPVIKRGVGVFAIWFVGYLVYTNQSVNYFLFCGWVNHVFVLPIVSLRDGSHQLATVEYNLQTRAISGIIAYAVALWIVLYGQEISQYTTLLGVDSAIALKSKEYLALGVIAGFDCYQANFWKSYCYPSSAFDSPKYSYLYIFGGRLPDELFLFPLEMFVMVCVVPNNKSLLENEYTTFIIAFIIYRLLQFGLEYRSASSATTKTVPINHLTSSPTRIINHFEQQQTPNNGCTSSTSNANKNDIPNNNICSMTKKNVWRIYGNRYDVTDFVNKHPGGIETIMLAANREDSTALFQSYHAFNIRKAKEILEKYRISNDTIVPTSVALMVKTDQKSIVLTTSNEDERSLDGETVSISDTDSDTSSATATDSKETPVGISSRHVLTSNHHDNDLFYDIISQRVAETLRLHNIDPIQDRGGTYGRYLFYILLFLGNIFALTLHCKVRTLYPKTMKFFFWKFIEIFCQNLYCHIFLLFCASLFSFFGFTAAIIIISRMLF